MSHPDPPAQTASTAEPAAQATCAHCGLAVPAGLIEPGARRQFCCNGCRQVFEIIHQAGLERYYELRRREQPEPQPARHSGRRFAEFDDPVFAELYCRRRPDGLQQAELLLEGVHCAACVWLVEKLPRVCAGVVEARLEMRRGLLQLVWDPQRVALSQIATALDSLGYAPHPAREARSRELRRIEDRRFLIRIGVAAALTGNVMLLAVALYGGMFTGIAPELERLFRWTSMGLGLVALLWPGSLFFRGALAALRTRTAHLDLPIAIALAAGGVAGVVNTVRDSGEIYFDSICALVFLLLVGRWLQHRQQRRAADAIELLFSLTPAVARRVEADALREVPVEALRPGELVEVRAGETFPADGVIESGRTSVDRAVLTGESRPVAAAAGDRVHAGAVNAGATVRVRVDAVGLESRLGRLSQLVERASREKSPMVQLADRLAGWFVAVVLTLAGLTLLIWMGRDPGGAVNHAVALLIVTCPCALGLATPLTLTAAIGRAARQGILIKGPAALEALARRGLMLLDKTGTLTRGRLQVVQWIGDQTVRPLLAALERHSVHPAARALAGEDEPARQGPRVDDVQQIVGGGITGKVDGRPLAAGTRGLLSRLGIPLPDWAADAQRDLARQALSPVLVALDGRVVAVVGLGDPLRDGTAEALGRLRRLGWQVGIISGDHPEMVTAVAEQLGMASADPAGPASICVGAAAPEEKLRIVRECRARGPVVMVGDGVNDAAALSAADVGIAVHGSAEASLAAADIHLSRPGVAPIVELVVASRRTLAAIRRCLAISLVYNTVTAGLAMAGLLGPLAAAVLMPLSSLTVTALAFSARTFAGEPCR